MLAVLPGLAATGAQVPFRSLVVVPGLVDAGTGLLFAIIAFSLDGSSALLVAALPQDPRLVAWSKLLVLAEVTLGAVVITTVLACCGARATCGDRGCRHPRQCPRLHHRRRGTRNGQFCSLTPHGRPQRTLHTIAPPSALVFASVRLTIPICFVKLAL